PGVPVGQDAPADPVARLEDGDGEALAAELGGGGETGGTGSDDGDVELLHAVYSVANGGPGGAADRRPPGCGFLHVEPHAHVEVAATTGVGESSGACFPE